MDDVYLRLQGTHDDQLIGVRELAVLLNTSEKNIYKLSSSDEDRLPPKWTGGGRKLTWRLGTCRAWIRDLDIRPADKSTTHQGLSSGAPHEKRTGRPRHAASPTLLVTNPGVGKKECQE